VCSAEVEAYWATVFQCVPDDLWRPGVVVTPHMGQLTDYRGVFLFRRRDACRVSAPPDLVEHVNDILRGRDAFDVFQGDVLPTFLGDRVERVIGPGWYGYVGSSGFRSASRPGCRKLTESDAHHLALLWDACGKSDWTEASFDKAPARFGCFDGDRLVAASNLTHWRLGDDRIGVVTHPAFRGRGYGAAAASAAIERALQTSPVVEWRARGTNAPSIEVALKLGFTHYGQNLAIRLRGGG
jgi:GNAT superfamily N-acetyltransferase